MLQHSHGRGSGLASQSPSSNLTFFVTEDAEDECGPGANLTAWIEFFSFVKAAVEATAILLIKEGIALMPTSSKAEADILFCHPFAVVGSSKSSSMLGSLGSDADPTKANDPNDPASWERLRGGPRRSSRRQSLVFVEDQDAASVFTPTAWAEHPDVVRVIKASRWHVEELRFACEAKKSLLGWRQQERHISLIKILSQEPTEAPFTDENLLRMFKETKVVTCPNDLPAEVTRKVVLGMPLYGYLQPSKWPRRAQWKPLAERSLDIVFASGFEIIPNALEFGQYRLETFNKMKGMKEKYPEWRMHLSEDAFWDKSNSHSNFDEYRDALCDAKILVSNYNYGEWSTKDFEAALCGTVLVKTGASLLDALPDVYRPNVTCLDVRPDLRDLESVLRYALDPSSLPVLEALRQHAYEAASPFHDVPGVRKGSEGWRPTFFRPVPGPAGVEGFAAVPRLRDAYASLVREVASRST